MNRTQLHLIVKILLLVLLPNGHIVKHISDDFLKFFFNLIHTFLKICLQVFKMFGENNCFNSALSLCKLCGPWAFISDTQYLSPTELGLFHSKTLDWEFYMLLFLTTIKSGNHMYFPEKWFLCYRMY